MSKILRITAGCILIAVIFYLSSLAVRDCTAGLYLYDNCLWAWVREQAGLPQSRFLQALTLFLAGLPLLAGLYATLRYIFPHRLERGPAAADSRDRRAARLP